MSTTTDENPLAQLADLLSKQADAVYAGLQKEMAAISVEDPEDQPELEIIRAFFAENHEQIKHLMEQQLDLLEELKEMGQDAPQAV
jgi:hypothetical protein